MRFGQMKRVEKEVKEIKNLDIIDMDQAGMEWSIQVMSYDDGVIAHIHTIDAWERLVKEKGSVQQNP